MNPTCETCRFWDDTKLIDRSERQCRRFPPMFAPILAHAHMSHHDSAQDTSYVTRFPFTYHDEWCGEHQPRDTKPMTAMLICGTEIDKRFDWPLGRAERLARRNRLPHVVLPDGAIRFDLAEVIALLQRVLCDTSSQPDDANP